MASALTSATIQAPDSKDHRWGAGPIVEYLVDIAFSGTYATGGEAFDPAGQWANQFPAGKIRLVSVFNSPGGYIPRYDSVNKKILYYSAPGTELANASAALAGGTAQARVIVSAI